jgi:hypothetical protein
MERIEEEAAALRARELAAAEQEAGKLRELARLQALQIADHGEACARSEVKRLSEELVARIGTRAVERALEGLQEELDDPARAAMALRMAEELRA